MIIRPYQPGDEKQILALFRNVFGKPMSQNYWDWRFMKNPTGLFLIYLAWDGDELAAHYAVSPVTISIEGSEFLTALSMTTMTHPSYRSRGLFRSLAEGIYNAMFEQGLSFVWGFPNTISHRAFIRELAWKDIYEIPMFRKSLKDNRPLPSLPVNVEESKDFHSGFDEFWAKVSSQYKILVKRDSQFLQWRYGSNPKHRYNAIVYCEKGKLHGYAVYKRYENDVDLVDLLSTNDEVSIALIVGVILSAMRKNCNFVNCWMNLELPLHREMEKIGFQNSEPVTYFGGKVLNHCLQERGVGDYKNWYLSLGDSDVY